MEIRKIIGHTRIIGKPVDWDEATMGPCVGLPVRDETMNGTNVMISAHKPDAAELARLAAGEPLLLGIYGRLHPVIFMAVGYDPAYVEENKTLFEAEGELFADNAKKPVVTWNDIATLAEYFQATRSPDWELEKYQAAADRVNGLLKAADLNAPAGVISEPAFTLSELVDVLHCCDVEAATISNRIAGPRGQPNHCPDGVQVLDDAETVIRAAFRILEAGSTRAENAQVDDDAAMCPICGEAFKPDDDCINDIDLGICRARHYGDEGPFVDLNTGDPLPEGSPPPKPFKHREVDDGSA